MLHIILLSVILLIFSKIINFIGKDRISESLWSLYSKISPSPTLSQLRKSQLRFSTVYQERNNTNAKNEFARWAKLDRELLKLKSEIEALQSQLTSTKTSFKSIVKVALFSLTSGFKLVFRFLYRKNAVFYLPPNIFPYFVYWILSFSSAPIGSVSVSWWLFIADSTFAMAEKMISLFLKEFVNKENNNKNNVKNDVKTGAPSDTKNRNIEVVVDAADID